MTTETKVFQLLEDPTIPWDLLTKVVILTIAFYCSHLFHLYEFSYLISLLSTIRFSTQLFLEISVFDCCKWGWWIWRFSWGFLLYTSLLFVQVCRSSLIVFIAISLIKLAFLQRLALQSNSVKRFLEENLKFPKFLPSFLVDGWNDIKTHLSFTCSAFPSTFQDIIWG